MQGQLLHRVGMYHGYDHEGRREKQVSHRWQWLRGLHVGMVSLALLPIRATLTFLFVAGVAM